MDYLATLNFQQRLAAEYGTNCESSVNGPLLVIAGAGTGKTNTLAHRVAHLVLSGTDPRRILLLTFSRRAAMEMERRTKQILSRLAGQPCSTGQIPTAIPWAGTFHSIGARLLREYAPRIGLLETFTLHDRGDAEDQLAIVRHRLGLSETKSRFPAKSTCLAIYSRVINSDAPIHDVLISLFPWCTQWEQELRNLFAAYVSDKQAQNVLDYDDLLLYWSIMVRESDLAREIGDRFDHVLVDEYQDTNRLQSSILLAIKPTGGGVTVVGDDSQSIYSFRAATVRNILDFPQHFVPSASVITLERNYRSTQPILLAANAVIGFAPERFSKNLWTERRSAEKPQLVAVRDEGDQASYVAERVLQYREGGMALKSQAVLFRSSSHSTQLELELARRSIPFVKFGGLKFLEAAHVKDLLSVLRWAENLRGRLAAFRVCCLLPGMGPGTATRLLDAIDTSDDPMVTMQEQKVPLAALEHWQEFLPMFSILRQKKLEWPADMDLAARWYEPHMTRIFDDAGVRQGDLVQLRQIASTYPTRERFLTELTLDPPVATSAEAGIPGRDEDYLILSTIHSAKGQEWKVVHILNVVDGCIPSDLSTGTSEEIEEERRLLYVAITRARDHLHLVVPQRFYVHHQANRGDFHVYALRSRFVPDSILDCFEATAWPVAEPNTPVAALATSAKITVDISARIRGLWR